MGSAAILGGSVIGCATALLLARSGWRVTLVDPEFDLQTDAARPPTPRAGAPHAVQAHGFPSRGPHELRTRLPDVFSRLMAAGAEPAPWQPPAHLVDGGRAEDSDLESFRTRRHLLDRVLAEMVLTEPGVTVERQRGAGLLLEAGRPPTVTGLGLRKGGAVQADVVVDAAGRRSPVGAWLASAGIQQPVDRSVCGLSYYGRQFKVTGPRPPLNTGFADIHEFPTVVQFLFVGDNDHVQLALSPHASDHALKALRHEGAFMAVLAANTDFADWLAVLEPVTPVFSLGARDNRMRSCMVDGTPLVLGLHQVGDALATTNPNRGRGIGMGLAAMGALVDRLTDGLEPADVTRSYAAWQRAVLAVYYRECVAADSELGRRLRANLVGDAAPATAPAVDLPAGHPVTSEEIERVAGADPDLFRIFVRALSMLDDEHRIASPEVATRVRTLLAEAPPEPAPPVRDRPLDDRVRLEELVAPWS